MKGTLLTALVVIGVVFGIIVIYKAIFSFTNSVEVISPAPGVQCVVVTEGFTAAVDCWSES